MQKKDLLYAGAIRMKVAFATECIYRQFQFSRRGIFCLVFDSI